MSVRRGPITAAELMAVWEGAVDVDYARPLVSGGDGAGLEVFGQHAEQLARVSRAVDVTTQAAYMRQHSIQSSPSASGSNRATVTLTLARTGLVSRALVLEKGLVTVEEVQVDHSPEGGVDAPSGRRYVLSETCFFPPGDQGPREVQAVAEHPGYGYNNPLPGSIRGVVQVGAGLNNVLATTTRVDVLVPSAVLVPASRVRVVCRDEPDVFVTNNVGQTMVFTGGANSGITARVTAYQPPDPFSASPDGGAADVELFQVRQSSDFDGPGFVEGEQVQLFDSTDVVAWGLCVAEVTTDGVQSLAYRLVNGDASTAIRIHGELSGSNIFLDTTGAITSDDSLPMVAESSPLTAWKVLDWVHDFGLTSTNASSPRGGTSAMLDALGRDRGIARAVSEGDDAYSRRISIPADTVTPNAIRRAINRVLAPLGLAGCFREVGDSVMFPGVFYDGSTADLFDSAGAYDYDFTVRPSDRFKVILDTVEMRAFFLVGVPSIPDAGDFGVFYDGATSDAVPGLPDAYDVGFFDGYARITSDVYRRLWQAIDEAHAGGVGFDLYIEKGTCP